MHLLKCHCRSVFFILIVLLSTIFSTQAEVIRISEINKMIHVGKSRVRIFEDKKGQYDFETVVRQEFSEKNPGYNENVESVYWIELEVFNDTKEEGFLIMEFLDPHLTSISMHEFGKKSKEAQGYDKPFSKKGYQHKNHVFDLGIPQGQSKVFYFKIHSRVIGSFGAKLQTNHNYTSYALTEYYLLGIFYGVLFIMFLYNVVLFLFTRNRIRIVYSFYVLCSALVTLNEDGIGFHFMWPGLPVMNEILAFVTPAMYMISFLLYTQSFLESKRFRKEIIIGAAVFVTLELTLRGMHRLPLFWSIIYIIPLVLTLYLALKKYSKGHREIGFLSVGIFLVIVSFAILSLRMYGIVESNVLMVYFFNFSAIVEVLVFSIALGEKIRLIQRENIQNQKKVIVQLQKNEALKTKVNRELEERIAERTKDLAEAKELLETKAEEISNINLQLDQANRLLQKEVKDVSKKRIQGTEIDPEEFRKIYPDKIACYNLLEDIKWHNGFECRKCGNDKYSNGTSLKSRRCTKCGTNETVTANTIFHGLRAPIESTFYLFSLIVQSKAKLPSTELALKTDIGQKTCWNLKKRVEEKMAKSSKQDSGWNNLILND